MSIEKVPSLISCFQNITSENLKQLSDTERKTLQKALHAIQHHRPCSAKALELIKNLHDRQTKDISSPSENVKTEEIFNLSESSIKKRVQKLFQRKISTSGIQKSINRVIHDELSKIELSLKDYQPFLNKNQFNSIQSTLKDLQKHIQYRGLSQNQTLNEKETLLFVLIEQFSKVEKTDLVFSFFNQAFNQQDVALSEKLASMNSYKSEFIPIIQFSFFEPEKNTLQDVSNISSPKENLDKPSLPLEGLKTHSLNDILLLNKSFKKLLEDNSPFFKALFQSSFRESMQDQFTLGEIREKDFLILLALLTKNETYLTELGQLIQKSEPIAPEDVIHIYHTVNLYKFTKLAPVTETLVIKMLNTLSPSDPEHLTHAINMYRVLDSSSLNPQIEELFGRFFANVLDLSKSPSQKNAILDVFNQIEVRHLIFGPKCHQSSLKGIEQISSLKILKLEGKHFNNGLFPYLKKVPHLEDLFLEDCKLNLNKLNFFKKNPPFKNMYLTVIDLTYPSFKSLLKQKNEGLPLKKLETNQFYNGPYAYLRTASPDYVSKILFDVDPSKNKFLGEHVKFFNAKGDLTYGGGVSFYDNSYNDFGENNWIYKWNGQGKEINKQGDIFEGNWKNDTKDGQGKLTLASGNIIEGEWKQGQLSGKVKVTQPNGDVCEGEWGKGDKLTGQGKIIFAAGGSYEGELKDDLPNGYGTKIYANGDRYTGNWKDNKASGYGTMKYDNGDRYEGNWLEDAREGQGTLKYANGNSYIGNFLKNEPHGRGILMFADKRIYVGNFFQGEMHGQGKLQGADGSIIYEGEFKIGKQVTQLKSFFADVIKKAEKNPLYQKDAHQVLYNEFQKSFSLLDVPEKFQLVREWVYDANAFQEKLKKQGNKGITEMEVRTILSSHLMELANRPEKPDLIIPLLSTLSFGHYDQDAFHQKIKEQYLTQIEETQNLTEEQLKVCQQYIPELEAYLKILQTISKLLKEAFKTEVTMESLENLFLEVEESIKNLDRSLLNRPQLKLNNKLQNLIKVLKEKNFNPHLLKTFEEEFSFLGPTQ